MDLVTRMNTLRANMVTAMPSRIITRDLLDFADRQEKDLKKGIFTVMSDGISDLSGARDLADLLGTHKILIAGQVFLGENASTREIEDAEFNMFRDLQAYAQAPGLGICGFDLVAMRQSLHVDHPYGWISVDAEIADLD